MQPRQIADHMLERMKAAAAEVWKEHAREIPKEDREEWAKLCKRHCANALAKEWGQ